MPTGVGPFSPVDRFAQVGLQMHDGVLATSIREFGMIALVDHEEHDGARAEIERYAVADMEPGMALQWIGQTVTAQVPRQV